MNTTLLNETADAAVAAAETADAQVFPTYKDELSQAQIDRQDEVDNAIFDLVNDLIPEKYRRKMPDDESQFDWDIEWIAELREEIQSTLMILLEIPDAQSDEFEMEFYPYLTEDATDKANFE